MKYILTFFYLSFFYLLSAQEAFFSKQAIYNLVYQPDSLDVGSSKNIHMELLMNDEFSFFQTLRKRQQDSVLCYQNSQSNSFSRGGIVMRLPSKFNYVVKKSSDAISVFDSPYGTDINGKEPIYHYTENPLNWELKDDTLHYADFICQKAELLYGGRKWIAWFTSDIPIAEGPYKFNGLPGLIVKISDDKNHWNFELVSFKDVSIRHTINFQNWYVVQKKSKKQLFDDRRTFQNSLITQLENQGINRAEPEYVKIKSSWANMLEKDNNWIELIY